MLADQDGVTERARMAPVAAMSPALNARLACKGPIGLESVRLTVLRVAPTVFACASERC
jgi:hypothetical protein